MDSPSKLDVVDWQDSPPPVVLKERAPRRFLSPTLIGILGTLLLHAAFIQSLPFGSRGPKVRPPEAQESAAALAKSNTHATVNLILITVPTTPNSQQAGIQNLISSLPDLSKLKIRSTINVDPPAFLNIETLALSENDPESKAMSDSADEAEKARMWGIYTGQIQARIDRVWRRPRTPIEEGTAAKKPTDADESFQCEAQIFQDASGDVQEVLLPRCNGSAAWRRSLVVAIQQASPLPAPPSVKVFSRSITLRFVGLAYVPGSSDDSYEIETRTLARE
jgi:hypothetical protein